MSEHATVSAPHAAAAEPGFYERHYFLFRRLHSLSGIVPVGVFVIMHLFTNFQIMAGDFQHEVEFIHSLPALLFMEIAIWGGIAFHAGLGLVYTFSAKPNAVRYPYQDNWRYTFQRITGILALIFIFLHVATLRWRWDIGGWFTPFFVAGPDGQPLVAATTAAALQHSVWVLVVYVIGVGSVIFHWANGLWTAAISWGITITPAAQRRWGYICAAIGIVLSIFAAGAIVGSLQYEITPEQRAQIRAAEEAYRTDGTILHRATQHLQKTDTTPAAATH